MIRMSVNMSALMLQMLRRQLSGKPPLVSPSGRHKRRRLLPRCGRAILRLVLRTIGHSFYIKMKWRWCRGEIRERRLSHMRLAVLAHPLRRRYDYIGLGKKLFQTEPLD